MSNFMSKQDRRIRSAMADQIRELTARETELVAGAGNTYTFSYDPETGQHTDTCHRTDDPNEASASI